MAFLELLGQIVYEKLRAGVIFKNVCNLGHPNEASRGPLKGAVSAQKALQGSETETRELLGGTEENSVSPVSGH